MGLRAPACIGLVRTLQREPRLRSCRGSEPPAGVQGVYRSLGRPRFREIDGWWPRAMALWGKRSSIPPLELGRASERGYIIRRASGSDSRSPPSLQGSSVSTLVESACGQMPSQLSRTDPSTPAEDAARTAWTAVLGRARRDLPPVAFEMWFSGLTPGKVKGQVIELIAPSGYVKSWLSGHYMDLIAAATEESVGPTARIRLRVAPTTAAGSEDVAPPSGTRPATGPGARRATPGDREGTAPHRKRWTGRWPSCHPSQSATPSTPSSRGRQQVRPRGGAGRGRGPAVQGVQPPVHLRRGGPGQDPPAVRHRQHMSSPWPPGPGSATSPRRASSPSSSRPSGSAGATSSSDSTATWTCCCWTTCSSWPGQRRPRPSSSTRSTTCTSTSARS